MRFLLQPGNLVICRVNTHRSLWDGTVCRDAENWNCTAPAHFRADYCANGDDRCFHVYTFAEADPNMVIEENGAGWLLEKAPDALDDQILVMWGSHATTAVGVPERDRREVLFGAYRVKSVTREDKGHRSQWRVRPYPDGWACFESLHHRRPRYESLGGPYLNQIDADDLHAMFSDTRVLPSFTGNDRKRYETFKDNLASWIEIARKKAEALHVRLGTQPHTTPDHGAYSRGLVNRPFSNLGSVVKPTATATATAAPPVIKPARPASKPRSLDVLEREPGVAAWIEATLGEDVLLDLRVALTTRDLVVLRGEPGVGKSHLALRLLDDNERERTLVVPVSATWRGREDLLGYVNPMDGQFVKTPFTRFLERAAEAWEAKDERTRMVVFEEFNLSQPEHWFADILAVSQYEEERDRVVQLAGTGAAKDASVFLSPAIRFVGTVNADHTTRPLSPRVLDRAAVIHLELGPKQALARIGLELEPKLVNAVAGLDFRLRKRGASFSIRTARSLQACLDSRVVATLDQALDLVLAQQVLSKVRLTAHDPADIRLLEELEQWCEEQQAGLRRCVAIVSSWRELLDAGLDVMQA